MRKPNVLWWNNERGSWACCNMLNEMFALYHCEHFTRFRPPDPVPEYGAVVVIHGGIEQESGMGAVTARRVNEATQDMKWCIFVVIGDEWTLFPTHLLRHPKSRLWVQTPLPTTVAHRYLLEGYPAGTKKLKCNQCQDTRQLTHLMSGDTQECPMCRRDLDFFFAGQTTHERRQACAIALRSITLQDHLQGSAVFTDSFGAGYPQEKYLANMSRAKIVPCPSGPASPDTFRIWESLECEAVPIVDWRSLREETVGVWDLVLPSSPLPFIDDWATLPEKMDQILGDYSRISQMCQQWWRGYREDFSTWLAKDMIALGVK